MFESSFLKEHLIIEALVNIKAYPCERMAATSIIYDYLYANGYTDLIKTYQLEPFELNVQTADRTLTEL